jgi:hypothetical protein
MKVAPLALVLYIVCALCIGAVGADDPAPIPNDTPTDHASDMVAEMINQWLVPLIVPFVLLGCILFIAWLAGLR